MSGIKRVATVILKKDDKILILKRSNKVSSFQGRWSGVSGEIKKNEEPAEAAIRELREETGIEAVKDELISADRPIIVTEGERVWKVYPFLLRVVSETISIEWEHDKYEWIKPCELQNYELVPRLDEVVRSLLSKENTQR